MVSYEIALFLLTSVRWRPPQLSHLCLRSCPVFHQPSKYRKRCISNHRPRKLSIPSCCLVIQEISRQLADYDRGDMPACIHRNTTFERRTITIGPILDATIVLPLDFASPQSRVTSQTPSSPPLAPAKLPPTSSPCVYNCLD